MKHKYEQTASKSIKETERRGFGATHEDSVFDWLDGDVTPTPHPLMMCGLSERRSQITFRTTKPSSEDFFLCNTLKNNNWDSAAANCTKIPHSLSVNY